MTKDEKRLSDELSVALRKNNDLRVGLATTWRERQQLARQCADLRDELATAEQEIEALRDHVQIIDDDRTRLTEHLLTFGVDDVAEQVKQWGSST